MFLFDEKDGNNTVSENLGVSEEDADDILDKLMGGDDDEEAPSDETASSDSGETNPPPT